MSVETLKLPPVANRVELAVQSLWNAMDDLMAIPAEELADEFVNDAAGRVLGIMAVLDTWRADLVRKKLEVNNVLASRPPYNRIR